MNFLIYNLFPSLNNLTNRQKLMLRLLIISVTMLLFGAYYKINDQPNADIIIGSAMIIQLISIIGLLSK